MGGYSGIMGGYSGIMDGYSGMMGGYSGIMGGYSIARWCGYLYWSARVAILRDSLGNQYRHPLPLSGWLNCNN
uniref:Uncharacterized protein n=1 Tax=Caenorhabditis japonica TaxID=281687 RepID=A0A8R1E522_CAEJA